MNKKYILFYFTCLILGIVACRDENVLDSDITPDPVPDLGIDSTGAPVDTSSYPDWDMVSHSNYAEIDYEMVFSQTEVKRLDIEISADDWALMQSNLSSIFGGHSQPGQSLDFETPTWFESSVKFNGKEWYHVGVRYKGNSSLQTAYQSGNNKLSLKLDFDEFEDTYPALTDQRFYGFKQLNLNNNYDDVSFMREKIGADLFRAFGVASAQTAFYEVYINNGTTTQYYGLYTLVEEVDDTVIKTQFSKDNGNLYKPDGDAATFALGTYDEDELGLKNVLDSINYSDVRGFYDLLNSSLRTSDEEAWKVQLDTIFKINDFLQYLAVNTTIQNWDTYGRMTHNYFLYNNPKSGKLTWIPWDNNEAFQEGKQYGSLSFSFSEINNSWPIIRYIIDIPEYKAKYEEYLAEFATDVFDPTLMAATYDAAYELIKASVEKEESGYTYMNSTSDFENAVSTLKSHAQTRNSAVFSYLQ